MTDILSEIQAFCERQSITPARFGELAMNDRGFVTRLRNGRDLKLSTAERLRRFMIEYQSEDTPEALQAPTQADAA